MTSGPSRTLAGAPLHPTRRRPAAWAGALLIGVGALVVAFPRPAHLAIGVMTGWLLWFAGALMFGLSLLLFAGRLRGIGAVAALGAVGLGAWLTCHPRSGALAAALLLTTALVLDGSYQLAAALHLRPLRAWRWLLASSAISFMAAAAAATRHAGIDLVPVLIAAALASSGAALIAVAAAPRQTDAAA